jgi:hypothetical protein
MLIGLVPVCLIMLVEILWYRKSALNIPLNQKQYWAHRAYSPFYPPNSVEGIEYNIDQGIKGVEIDVYYDDTLNTFIVSHDFPYTKIDGDLLLLDTVFTQVLEPIHYWLDLKNLNADNYHSVSEKLSSLAFTYHQNGNLWLESDRGYLLSKMDKKNFKKIYWPQYSREWYKRWLKLLYIKTLVLISDFDAFDVVYFLLDEDYVSTFSAYPLFVSYLENSEAIKNTESIPNVQVLLIDTK